MTVFHLKYRPLFLTDLDLVNVAATLKKVLAAKDIPQSFLLAGPKGSGKTSAARIIARAVNCEKPDGVEPCGKCASCQEISAGNSIDILEIDAASNRGIDDVRLIKDRAFLLPSKLKKKVIIIDEVHMLTKEAFNALLKLIEEPPGQTTFILCTTDPNKIPETVLSRLIRIDFKKGSKQELMTSLKKVIDGEKIKIDGETIDLIVSKSDGSFRNLQKNFFEMYLQLGKTITRDGAINFYRLKEGDYPETELEADLALGKINRILERIEKLAETGLDFSDYRQKLIIYFQGQLLSYFGINRQSAKLSQPDLERLIALLIEVGRWEKEVELKQLPLEMAIIKFNPMDRKSPETIKKAEPKKEVVEAAQKPKKEKTAAQSVPVIKTGEIESRWAEILAAVKPYNHSVEAFLRATRPKEVVGNKLVLDVYYQFHKDKLDESRNREIVETGLKQVLGRELLVECRLTKNKKLPEITLENKGTPDQAAGDIYDVAKEIFGT